jgi:hypothetical protein
MNTLTAPLNNLQRELLKVCSVDIDDQELLEIKNLLSQFFANRLVKEASKVWKERGYTNETIDTLINDENQ